MSKSTPYTAGILMTTLEEGTPGEFIWKNLEISFLFHPKHWKIVCRLHFNDTRKYTWKVFRFNFLFVSVFIPFSLVRKKGITGRFYPKEMNVRESNYIHEVPAPLSL
jgi:hypothetical protein